jgi:streptomycin 6-kinase
MAAAVPAGRLERGAREARVLAAGPVAAVVLHGDLHPANVLDGGPGRGLVAIDPRPCVGDPGVDAIDWVFWEARTPRQWALHAERLAAGLDYDPARLWRWCGAFAAMLAARRAARGAPAAEVAALLELAP